MKPDALDAHSRRILDLVARGDATSRARLASEMRLAASTVGNRVQALLDAGLLEEDVATTSQGGRPPRTLRLVDDGGVVVSVDMGGSHLRVGRHGGDGTLLETTEHDHDLAAGPERSRELVTKAVRDIVGRAALRAVGVSLPGPVDLDDGTVQLPSRMPGWAGHAFGVGLQEHLGVPVVVDNDANVAALGEHLRRFGSSLHSITVKAGTAIGSGIVVNGRLHRGATFAAGDISHTRIDRTSDVPCSCGNTGCLETVASGAGLVRQLNEQGVDVPNVADVLALAADAHPIASQVVRRAGHRLGEVLSGVVNFFNPHAVFLTGSLSASEPFIAAVRSRVYESCHPLVTRELLIEAAHTGPDAILYGAARLALDSVSGLGREPSPHP